MNEDKKKQVTCKRGATGSGPRTCRGKAQAFAGCGEIEAGDGRAECGNPSSVFREDDTAQEGQ